jgi:hypothetical protein
MNKSNNLSFPLNEQWDPNWVRKSPSCFRYCLFNCIYQDTLLYKAHVMYGNSWSKVATHMGLSPAYAMKCLNRWESKLLPDLKSRSIEDMIESVLVSVFNFSLPEFASSTILYMYRSSLQENLEGAN